MKALVTGGCGFIGSNLVKKLVSEGHSVEVVDDLSNGDLANLVGLDIRVVPSSFIPAYEDTREEGKTVVITGDFASSQVLSRIAEKRYDTVFHLAAVPRVEYSVKNPVSSNEQNVSKTLALMTACVENINRFVFSSSSAIYGDCPDNFPSIENGKVVPSSPYGLQKKIIEEYCSLYYSLYGLESVCLRYFNVYGPGQPGDSPYSTAVSAWMDKIFNNLPLRSDGDGEQTRDMIYVDDVVNANILAASPDKKVTMEIFNIGTGKSVSNNEILKLLEENFTFKKESAPERKGDVKHTMADMSYSNEKLNFFPSTDFKQGLQKTISWWKENAG